jgi:hypothetical protein
MVVNKAARLLPIIAICLIAPAAFAQSNSLDSSFTVFGAMRTGGSFQEEESDVTFDAKDSGGYGLIWNTRQNRNTEWEVYFSHQPTEVERQDPLLVSPTFDLDIYTLQLGGTYLFDSRGVQSFLSMTLGGTHMRADSEAGDSETYISGSIGLGLKFREGERLGFRLEGRAHGVLVQDNSRLFCRTGPEENVCAVEIEGEFFSQFEILAGITYRF